MPTYTCTAACKNCGTLSSPRERTNLTLNVMLSAIQQARELNFANIVFTGGEATLRWKDLLQAIEYAHSLGMPTRLVTNAHWAHSIEIAQKRLTDLIQHGLSEINYSTGDEHIRFVPLDKVIYATVSALTLKLPVHIMVEYKKNRTIRKADILEHPLLSNFLKFKDDLLNITESPWMPLNPMTVEEYPPEDTVNLKTVTLREGCDNVLQTYTLQADGNIGACCGLGLRLVKELNTSHIQKEFFLRQAIEEAENDFLKLWIHYKGPEKILAWAAEKNPTIVWENMYAHRCQACHRIYKDPEVSNVVREHYAELLADVLQSAWLDEYVFPQTMP